MTTFRERLFGRTTSSAKAVYGGPALVAYQNGIPLSVTGGDWNGRAKAYLAAYRVGWFYKAGSRISQDFANLPWTLAYEDSEGDNEEDITAPANNIPFERLDALAQFLRLSERPNPYQTGRAFKQQQMIRLDFTGRALTWLEGGDGGDLPTGLYGISPERMWQSRDKSTGELIGWVLDKDTALTPATFSVSEILATEYPGTSEEPIGVVESVYAHVPLTRQIPQHTSDMLSTGGRLAGMAWPKERTLNEAEFMDAQRAWRSVTSDPNAARRLLLFPEPMEYQSGAATPQEIGIPELSSLNRDEILTAFPINPYMVGVPQAAGLNSGESLRYVKQEYWDGTMHPRVEVWEDSFQQQLIPRYEAAVGRPLDFDITEPDMDDAESLTLKAEAYKALVSIGFDPKESVSAVGLDAIKWLGLPSQLDPAKQAEAAQAQLDALNNRPEPMMAEEPQKPVPPAIKSRRDEVHKSTLPDFEETMRRFLADQRSRIARDIEETTKAKHERKATPDEWWNAEREDRLLGETLRGLYLRLSRSALTQVADAVNRTVLRTNITHITERLLEDAGERITGINETTRKAVADQVAEGVRRGYSPSQIANGVGHEGFAGVRGASAFDDARAEVVARTETMLAYNKSALLGYDEFGVQKVEAIDGDYDPECAERNGQVFAIEEALGIEDHPNGTLDWAPIFA